MNKFIVDFGRGIVLSIIMGFAAPELTPLHRFLYCLLIIILFINYAPFRKNNEF